MTANPLAIRLDDSLQQRVRIAAVEARPVVIREASPELVQEIARTADDARRRFQGLAPAAIRELAPARELYRAFGVDPTKIRPSSEGLLRRVLRGARFPAISNAVDLANLLAVRFLLPIGLYDLDRVVGGAVLRSGRPGEWFDGIRKDPVHLEGRPVLADDEGAFGNPTSDSLRTSVRTDTGRLLLVLFAPFRFPEEDLEQRAEETAGCMRDYLGDGATPVVTRWRVYPTAEPVADSPS